MKRRNFITKATVAGVGVSVFGSYACKDTKKVERTAGELEKDPPTETPFFELSLAQWSLHKMILDDGVDPYSFAQKAKSWGFKGLEYVSQLYKDVSEADYSDAAMAAFIEKSNAEAEKHGMQNVLIMIDRQGDLAVNDVKERDETVEKHKKWVDAAAAMGCHSIRVNLNGSNEPEEWIANSVDGLTKLATYAKDKNINILVENHGGLSSNGELHAQVMEKVGMANVGTLPDFGNFCITRKPDSWECETMYDKYQGVKELMPYAKAVSAKSNVFDGEGNEVQIDYVKMLQMVKDHGYTGFVGVEYEGSELSEEDGIIATRDLLLKAAKKLV